MALEFGEDNAVAIAQIAADLRQYSTGAIGAATSIYARRMQDFAIAVKQYQDALLDYRSAVKSNPAASAAAEQKAIKRLRECKRGFKGRFQRSAHQQINPGSAEARDQGGPGDAVG
jgi:hypothetical protein